MKRDADLRATLKVDKSQPGTEKFSVLLLLFNFDLIRLIEEGLEKRLGRQPLNNLIFSSSFLL